MKQWLMVMMLACICCLAAIKGGQTQNADPLVPIRIGGARATSGPTYPSYSLRFLQVSGTKPTEYVWLLQKQGTVSSNGAIEPNETVFRSLDSPILRDYVSHLPEGTRIEHSSIMLPGPDPTQKVGSDSEPGLQDFIKFCHSNKIDFWFGVTF